MDLLFTTRMNIDDLFKAHCEVTGVQYCISGFLAWLITDKEWGHEIIMALYSDLISDLVKKSKT